MIALVQSKAYILPHCGSTTASWLVFIWYPIKPNVILASFGFSTKPKQMIFFNWPTSLKQIGPNVIIAFSTKPKQITFGNESARPNQMWPYDILTFGTKTSVNWSARPNQLRQN